MATNLVSSAMQFLTPDLVAKIARTLDIDSEVAQSVVGAAVPAILAEGTQNNMMEDRRVVARRLFDALCAQYPDKYIALIQPRDVEDGPPDLTTGKAPPAR